MITKCAHHLSGTTSCPDTHAVASPCRYAKATLWSSKVKKNISQPLFPEHACVAPYIRMKQQLPGSPLCWTKLACGDISSAGSAAPNFWVRVIVTCHHRSIRSWNTFIFPSSIALFLIPTRPVVFSLLLNVVVRAGEGPKILLLLLVLARRWFVALP